MAWLAFMREVIRNNKTTGAIAPSSRELAERIVQMADISGKKMLVEFGAGDGVFTREILRQKDADAEFFSLEINPSLAEACRKSSPGATIITDSAENVRKHLQALGHGHCDAIISGLPWSRFDDGLQDRILAATCDALAPGGIFVTFAYVMTPYLPAGKRFLTARLPACFASVRRSGPIWNNLPPCHVYICTKQG